MGAAVRVGWALAASPHVASRARRLVVAVAAAVVTFLWLGGLSVRTALDVARSRASARTPVVEPSDTAPATASRVADRLDFIDGHQFTVRWLYVPSAKAPPPGVDLRRLKHQRFLVSPALESAIDRTGSTRFSGHGRISRQGLTSPDELFAYAQLPRDLTTVGIRVASFGSDRFATADVEPLPFGVGVLVFLVVPGSLLLSTALATRSAGHAYRCQLLRLIGVRRAHIVVVGMIESIGPSLIGALLGCGLHGWWSASATRVPVVGRHTFAGDLQLGAVGYLLVVAAVVTVAGAIGALIAVRRSRLLALPRPTRAEAHPRRYRLAPLGLGLACLLAGLAVGHGRAAAHCLLAATVLLVPGVPLALPAFAAAFGRVLATRSNLVLWMAGRRIERDPRGAMRPLMALAAALTLVMVVIGYIAVVDYDDVRLALPADVQVAIVRHPQAIDEATMHSSRSRNLVMVPFDDASLTIGASCAAIATSFSHPARTCRDDGTLSGSARDAIAASLGGPPWVREALHLGAVEAHAADSEPIALVLGRPRSDFAEEVRTATESLTAPEVTDNSELSLVPDSTLVLWLLGGLALAATVALTALALLTVDRYGRSVSDHGLLGAVGISGSTLWRLETLQFAASASVTLACSFLAGVTAALVMTSAGRVPAPTSSLVFAGSVSLAGVAVCTIAVATISRHHLVGPRTSGSDRDENRWIT